MKSRSQWFSFLCRQFDVIACHSVITKKPTQYSRTEEYIPERWLRGNTEFPSAKEAHPFAYMPFGFGPRTCIGRRFAEMELETLLLTVRKLARPAGNFVARGIQSVG